MRLISNKDYREYQDLKSWAIKQKVWQSAKEVTKLEDDIDLPIRKCVAGLALLGITPIFSCCGFDYNGQPYHKYHQYDRPYIVVDGRNMPTELVNFFPWKGWTLRPHAGHYYALEFVTDMNPSWRSRDCIHSAEECVIGVSSLETLIVNTVAQSNTPESVTLFDTNHNHKKRMRFWQYPPKSPWEIRREWVIS